MSQQIYFNGDILTMEDKEIKEAVLVEDGKIKIVGTEQEVFKSAGSGAEKIDLNGSTLMPAFIDSHSHIFSYAMTISLVRLDDVKSFDEIAERLKNRLEEPDYKARDWIIGFGYDHNLLKEGKHPGKALLDSVSESVPVMVTHASGHMGVFNSAALKAADIKDSRDGYLEETAFIAASAKVPKPPVSELIENMKKAEKTYLSYGITYAQEGKADSNTIEFLKMFSENYGLKLDISAYLDAECVSDTKEKYAEYFKHFKNRLKIGGYKIFLDGSPQAKTAWMKKPYEGTKNETGFKVHSDSEVEEYIKKSVADDMQLLAHCNGNMACEQYITCWERAGREKMRPVMIHAQTVERDSQLPRMKKIGMIPSFFISHIYHWGDIHIKNLGDRAETISPAGTAEKLGMIYTFHTDTPVIKPDMMECVWCAVNRTTADGKLLGEPEKLSVYDALRAVTINAAYQYFEEHERGSIAPGKRADFAVLRENPLKADVRRLKDIEILRTIKDGKTVFEKNK